MDENEILEAFAAWLERFGELPMDDYLRVLDVLTKDLHIRIKHVERMES